MLGPFGRATELALDGCNAQAGVAGSPAGMASGAVVGATLLVSDAPQVGQYTWPGSTGDEHAGQSEDSTTRKPPLKRPGHRPRTVEVSRDGPLESIPRSLRHGVR
jgi:hypothetical protein